MGLPEIPDDFGSHRERPHEKIDPDDYADLFDFDEDDTDDSTDQ